MTFNHYSPQQSMWASHASCVSEICVVAHEFDQPYTHGNFGRILPTALTDRAALHTLVRIHLQT